MSSKLSHSEKWNGEHRGVRYQVSLARREPLAESSFSRWSEAWCYYLFIPIAQVPDDKVELFNLPSAKNPISPNRVHYDYMSAPILSDLDWHCGITYYEKHGGLDGDAICIQAGCDYQHCWDEGHYYDLDIVANDARASIDKLLELVPDLKIRCGWFGTYGPATDGETNEHGVFYSTAGLVASKEYFAKREAELCKTA